MRITGHVSGIDHAGNSRKGTSADAPQAGQAVQKANPGSAEGGAKNILALARGLGLPADRFSASIISSARYFSLPLEPGLLAKLRREAAAGGRTAETAAGKNGDAAGKTGAGAVVQGREALSLGAAAAASKGVMLRPDALDEYAAAIDPGRRRPPGGEKGEEGRAGTPADGKGAGGGGTDNGGGGSAGAGTGGSPKNGAGGHTGAEDGMAGRNGAGTGRQGFPGDPAALREGVLGAMEKTPLLRLLNRIPGKNGRRWLVLPFAFTEKEREYGISLRIMLEGNRCRMALDVTEEQNGETLCRRLFVMERAAGETPSLGVSLRPGRREAELRSLKKNLESLLDLSQDHIQIKNADNEMDFSGFFPQDDLLPSVNEEV
jgi:hypothetical protein